MASFRNAADIVPYVDLPGLPIGPAWIQGAGTRVSVILIAPEGSDQLVQLRGEDVDPAVVLTAAQTVRSETLARVDSTPLDGVSPAESPAASAS